MNSSFQFSHPEMLFSALSRVAIISVSDLSGKIVYCNELFCKISGFSVNELIGQNHRIISSGYHSDFFWKEFWQKISKGESWAGEVQNKKKNGEFYWVYSIVCPVKDGNGKIQQYVSFRYDITEHKKTQNLLELEKANAIHLSKLADLGEMASGIAHEINNPNAIIAGQVSILRKVLSKENHLTEKIEKILSVIEANITRVSKIIKTFKNYSYRGTGEQNFDFISSNKVVNEALTLVSEKIKKSGVQILLEITDVPVFCDPSQIEQVLVNLLNNASYELEKQLSNKWIQVSCRDFPDHVEFSVMDSGPGISADFHDKIMKPFFTTKPLGQGTGLGLSICFKIIEGHKGQIYLDKKSDHTKFVFLIPKNGHKAIQSLNFSQVIQSHLNWKLKIVNEYKKQTNSLNAKEIENCLNCELGQWILASQESLGANLDFQELQSVHRKFHYEAAQIVRSIQEGNTTEIHSLIRDIEGEGQNEYSRCSREISELLRKIETKLK